METSNRLKYNSKERVEETGLYDYGARWYDPATARWGQVDPLADIYTSISAYAYVANNPLIFIDPDGMSISSSGAGVTLTGADAQNYFRSLQASAGLNQEISGTPKTTMTYSHEITYAGSINGDKNEHSIHEIEKWTEVSFNEEGNVRTERQLIREGVTTIDENGMIVKSWSSSKMVTSERERSATSRGYQWIASDPVESTFGLSFTEDASNRSERARKYVHAVQGHLREDGPNWSPFEGNATIAFSSAAAGWGIGLKVVKINPVFKRAIAAGVILGNTYRGLGDHRERSGQLYFTTKTLSQ